MFDYGKYRRLLRLFEETESTDVIVNPTPREFKRFMKTHDRMGRMLVSPEGGDIVIWDAYYTIHSDMIRRLGFDIESDDLLTQYSLYAFPDVAAARAHEVDNEEPHSALTRAARMNPNMVRIWGRNVIVIDIHGEP